MTSELDKARAALESFDMTRDAYEDARTRDDRAYLLSMLDGHDAHDVDHLRAALAEVDRLTAALAEAEATIANERAASEQRDTEAWTRGFFMALATHADDAGREEGIATTNIRTVKQAIAAGVEEQDAEKLRRRFAVVRELELDLKKRAAARAAMRAATKETP